MNKYWYILQLYLWRPRFWVLGITYLLFVWGPFVDSGLRVDSIQTYVSATFTCVIGCFLGLHVRRQFANSAAHLLPGYAVPHLVVAGLVLTLLWLLVPAMIVSAGYWPPGALAIHAVAALFAAVLACWPRALLMLTVIPALIVWGTRPSVPREIAPLVQLVKGDLPALAALLIALAFIAQAVAVILLLRLPRTGVTASDEFTIDAAGAQDLNPLSRWLNAARDAAADRLLQARRFTRIQRWRVPTAISPAHIALVPLLIATATGVGWLTGDWHTWFSLSAYIACGILLVVPLSPWHVRRRIMSMELMRPVSRERYFREVMLSLACDLAVWMAVALAIMCTLAAIEFGFVAGWQSNWERFLVLSAASFGFLCSLAIFVYGVGVATMRLPMWLPIVALTTYLGVPVLLVVLSTIFSLFNNRETVLVFGWLPALLIAIGLLLTFTTYRRWLRSDVP